MSLDGVIGPELAGTALQQAEQHVADQAAQIVAKAQQAAKARELTGDDGVSLLSRLRRHDWSYDFSDDSAVWARGQQQLAEIRTGMQLLGRERARQVWDLHFEQDPRSMFAGGFASYFGC